MSTGAPTDPVRPAAVESDRLLHRICGEIASFSLHLKVELKTESTTLENARRILTEYAYDLLRAHSASVVDSRSGYLGLAVDELRKVHWIQSRDQLPRQASSWASPDVDDVMDCDHVDDPAGFDPDDQP